MNKVFSQLQAAQARYLLVLTATLSISYGYLQFDTTLAVSRQWSLLSELLPVKFDEFVYLFATAPRLAIALMVGAILGLAGSLLQQITHNRLLSPLTLGTSSGAWLALIAVSVWLPGLDPDITSLIVMGGALAALGLVVAIAGLKQLAGLPIILAGMAVNILLGAITTAIILLRDQYAKQLFIWGAGDLAQNDWLWLEWLAPKLAVGLVVLIIAPRVLQLLKLGQSAASARGLALAPTLTLVLLATLWLVSASITAVGIISFVGLIAPNIARLWGARSAADQLFFSAFLGAILLLICDFAARAISQYTVEVIPTGTATALCGAPVLILLALKKLRAEDQLNLQALPVASISRAKWLALALLLIISLVMASLWNNAGFGWAWHLPNSFDWQLRSPRIIGAMAAGIAMAVAGTLLQRLIYNPLASPDLLGVSAGASAALVIYSLAFGIPPSGAGPAIALLGSGILLWLLLLLARRQQFAPGAIILLGLSLTAMVEALIQFTLANGSQDVYAILGWLAGTTYHMQALDAAALLLIALLVLSLALAGNRALTLLGLGKAQAQALGLSLQRSYGYLLVLVAIACAAVTALLGPIGFVGLLAPHLARLLGAQNVRAQLIAASLIGANLLILADWLGRNLLYPSQVAAGTLASAIGGGYFVLLLLKARQRT